MIVLVRVLNKLFKLFFNIKLNVLLWTGVLVIFVVILTWTDNLYTLYDIRCIVKNPVIVWWTKGFPGTYGSRHCASGVVCEVSSDGNIGTELDVGAYLFYGSNIDLDELPLPRRPQSVIWGLYHEESPRNVEDLMHHEVLGLFNYSSTFSRHSDIPYTLQYLSSLDDLTSIDYFVTTTEKNLLLNRLAPVLYLQSDCETSTERDAYVRELMTLIRVDSYGLCLNNKALPKKFTNDYLNNLNEDEFLKFIARYKFVIAIENGVCEDYITEKLWRALKVGSVPIYFGSPSVRDWLPNNLSAILLQEFDTVEKLKAHIIELMHDDVLYEQYLDHKIKREIKNLKLIEEFGSRPWSVDALETASLFECLVCEKLHEKRRGVLKPHIVDRHHYDCPKPISALTLSVNPSNSWVMSREKAKLRAQSLYKKVTNT